MSYPDPLLLKNVAATAVPFNRMKSIPNGWNYVAGGSSFALTDTVDARSISTPQKGDSSIQSKQIVEATTRQIITFGRSRIDTDDRKHEAKLSLSLARCMSTDITSADIDELFAFMAEFLIAGGSTTYKTRFIRGET